MSRHVAIKVVYSDSLANPSEMLRLQQEAQLAGQLSHPNIVTLYDVNYQQDAAYIIMEYLEGRTLAELLRSNLTLSAPFAVDIIEQVAAGLDEAHRRGIVHRDMKPSNIMILDDQRVKITDFGLAKLMRGSTLTRPGHLIGTPSYMSPEQARGVEVSPQSDQFSLAIVAYRILVGRLPFDGEMFQNVIHQIAEGDPYPIPSGDIPEAAMLSKILLRAMARRDRDRYVSCRDFASDLRRWLHHALENQKTPTA
jgi:serine/threonine-protein kinase